MLRKKLIISWFCLGLLQLGGGNALGQEMALPGTPEDYQLTLAGNDQVVWLMAGRSLTEESGASDLRLYQRLAYQDRQMNKVAEAPVGEQVGRIRLAAVAGDRLHVFFDDASHYRYTPLRSNRELQLPDRAMPAAIAGESEGTPSRLWAVVSAVTADEVERNWLAAKVLARSTERSTALTESQPDAEMASATEVGSSVVRDPGSFHLVSYADGLWQPGPAAPASAAASERFWLACREHEIHLFWQIKAGNRTIHHAVYFDSQWTTVNTFHLSQLLESACCFVTNTQLYFAVVQQDPSDAEHRLVEYLVWSSDPGGAPRGNWVTQPGLRLGEQDLRLRPGAAIAGFANQLIIAQWRQGRAEIGYWPIAGGSPVLDFSPVLETKRETISPRRQGLKEIIATLAVMLMLLLIWWRRQQSIAVPIALPPGLALAGPHKRLAAALIDILPAATVVMWYWYEPLQQLHQQMQQLSREQIGELPISMDLWWAGIWFRALYMGYCLLFELILKATPGKLLLGCRVSTETLEKPMAAQIAIRNVTKLVELEPMLIALPMLIVFTRNRQRLGDLIARTVVVERQSEQLMPPSSDSENQDE
ncbi:MAG: RDD family protein [Phycisphaerales bacterium]|nr:RDD family protein [Phycisphaerales bacterium]